MKSSATTHALLIGVMVGVAIYGVASGNFGFFALIAIYFAFRLFTKRTTGNASEGVSNEGKPS